MRKASNNSICLEFKASICQKCNESFKQFPLQIEEKEFEEQDEILIIDTLEALMKAA